MPEKPTVAVQRKSLAANSLPSSVVGIQTTCVRDATPSTGHCPLTARDFCPRGTLVDSVLSSREKSIELVGFHFV
jgi:hypothetical protein